MNKYLVISEKDNKITIREFDSHTNAYNNFKALTAYQEPDYTTPGCDNAIEYDIQDKHIICQFGDITNITKFIEREDI